MGGSVRKRLLFRGSFVAGLVVLPLVALACTPSGGGGGVFVPRTTTTTSTTLPWTEPVGVNHGFDMDCAVFVANTYQHFGQSASVNIDAPDTVAEGETFNIMVAPATFIVPLNVGPSPGYAVRNLTHFAIAFPLSPNVEFIDSVMTAGINMGPGYPSLTIQNGMMIYQVPGPFTPGDTVQMPAVRLTFKATGPTGSIIETRLAWLRNVANLQNGLTVGDTCALNDPTDVFHYTFIQ